MPEATLEKRSTRDHRSFSGSGYIDPNVVMNYSLKVTDANSHIGTFFSAHDTGQSFFLPRMISYLATSPTDVPVWIGYVKKSEPQTSVAIARPSIPSLSEIARGLRERLDLPLMDVASLCGVKRRQFYNLLSGESRRTAEEQHMRLLRDIVEDLDGAVGGDAVRLRAAVLMPVTDDYKSLFDVASDPVRRHELSEIAGLLVEGVRGGDVSGMIPRPSPALRGLQADASLEAADEELRGTTSPPPERDVV